jgi:hypothetical protein
LTSLESPILAGVQEGFWTTTRIFYVLLAGTFALSQVRRSPRLSALLVGALLGLGWLASNHGLSRIYGLVVPGDRARNLSWCMSAAAGNSPLGTGIVGQTSLEPFWASLVATLSGFDADRALALYPYLSLLGLLAVAGSLYVHFRRFDDSGEREPGGPSNAMLGLTVAAFATLFATSALDYLGPFRGFWAKMFLLKPNHTVGFILLPMVVSLLLRGSGKRAVAAGLGLGVLSLAFVVHWAFVCFALVLYLGLTFWLARSRLAPELRRIGAAVLVSSLFVAPGIYVIAKYFPHALTLAAGTYPEAPMRSDWGDTMPIGVSFLFLVTLEQGAVFYLSLAGVFAWLRERTRATLIWASLWIGAYLLWGLNYLLYLTARAREADEFYFFLIFVQAIAAGYGAYRLATRLGQRLFDTVAERERAGALALVLAAPLGFPFWWNPAVMDNHYRAALEPVWQPVIETTDWIRQETNGKDVFLAAGDLWQWIPALSGRRTLPYSEPLREPLLRLLNQSDRTAVPADYIVWSSELDAALGEDETAIARSPCCRVVHDSHVFRVYSVLPEREVEE